MEVEERIKVVEVLALGIDPPVIADAGTSLREIIREMRDRRASCALLTREGRLAGVFTERDAVTRVVGVHGVLAGPVAEVMTSDPEHVRRGDRLSTAVTVSEETTVREAFGIMKDKAIGSVVVVDGEGRLAGLFTERDILALVADEDAAAADRPVSELMTRDPETTTPTSTLAEVIHRLTVSDLLYLPILSEEGRPVSILAARDLVDFLSDRIEN